MGKTFFSKEKVPEFLPESTGLEVATMQGISMVAYRVATGTVSIPGTSSIKGTNTLDIYKVLKNTTHNQHDFEIC